MWIICDFYRTVSLLQGWLNRLFFNVSPPLPLMTNWPSSSNGGELNIKQQVRQMTPSSESEPKQNDSSRVSDETILKISKEIVVKFIEMGKITPAGFDLNFKNIYTTIDKTVRNK